MVGRRTPRHGRVSTAGADVGPQQRRLACGEGTSGAAAWGQPTASPLPAPLEMRELELTGRGRGRPGRRFLYRVTEVAVFLNVRR
jgi:hypothetical protein